MDMEGVCTEGDNAMFYDLVHECVSVSSSVFMATVVIDFVFRIPMWLANNVWCR